jgi:hypothetical protein
MQRAAYNAYVVLEPRFVRAEDDPFNVRPHVRGDFSNSLYGWIIDLAGVTSRLAMVARRYLPRSPTCRRAFQPTSGSVCVR